MHLGVEVTESSTNKQHHLSSASWQHSLHRLLWRWQMPPPALRSQYVSGIIDHCDQCECTYHEECLEDLTSNAGDAFICPKCRDTLDEVMYRRLNQPLPPPPWERYSIPLRMLDPKVLPECQIQGCSLTAVLTS